MSIGRNDPCPCGSGKKYKRCHGAQSVTTRPDVARANVLKAVDQDLTSRLMRFTKSHYGLGWLDEVLTEYAGDDSHEVPEHELSLALPWALHFRRDDDGVTAANAWESELGRRVTDDQRIVLHAYDNAWLSIWEVARVERGVGTALVDQLTRAERFAHDVSSSGMLSLHDALLAIIVDCDGISFFGGVHPQPVPPVYAADAIREARTICRVRTRAVTPERLRDHDVQLDLIDLWNASVSFMHSAPPPTITNTDGDLLSLTTDDFELVAPRDEVVARLASMPGAGEPEEADDGIVVVFTKAGNAQHRDWDNTVTGRAVVGDARLRLETNSLRRADELRGAVEHHLAGTVRYRLRQETNTADLMARASAGPSSSRGGVSRASATPPELAAMLRSMREQHMRSWVDEEIPMLGGLTPRAAARTPRARGTLEVLLKDIERDESRLPANEQIDLSWLRPELGMQ